MWNGIKAWASNNPVYSSIAGLALIPTLYGPISAGAGLIAPWIALSAPITIPLAISAGIAFASQSMIAEEQSHPFWAKTLAKTVSLAAIAITGFMTAAPGIGIAPFLLSALAACNFPLPGGSIWSHINSATTKEETGQQLLKGMGKAAIATVVAAGAYLTIPIFGFPIVASTVLAGAVGGFGMWAGSAGLKNIASSAVNAPVNMNKSYYTNIAPGIAKAASLVTGIVAGAAALLTLGPSIAWPLLASGAIATTLYSYAPDIAKLILPLAKPVMQTAAVLASAVIGMSTSIGMGAAPALILGIGTAAAIESNFGQNAISSLVEIASSSRTKMALSAAIILAPLAAVTAGVTAIPLAMVSTACGAIGGVAFSPGTSLKEMIKKPTHLATAMLGGAAMGLLCAAPVSAIAGNFLAKVAQGPVIHSLVQAIAGAFVGAAASGGTSAFYDRIKDVTSARQQAPTFNNPSPTMDGMSTAPARDRQRATYTAPSLEQNRIDEAHKRRLDQYDKDTYSLNQMNFFGVLTPFYLIPLFKYYFGSEADTQSLDQQASSSRSSSSSRSGSTSMQQRERQRRLEPDRERF